MLELLFEGYAAPAVSLGADALFGYHANGPQAHGLLLHAGHHATHLLPIVHGRAHAQHAKR